MAEGKAKRELSYFEKLAIDTQFAYENSAINSGKPDSEIPRAYAADGRLDRDKILDEGEAWIQSIKDPDNRPEISGGMLFGEENSHLDPGDAAFLHKVKEACIEAYVNAEHGNETGQEIQEIREWNNLSLPNSESIPK